MKLHLNVSIYLFAIFIFCFSNNALAQKDFYTPGLIITMEGDTLSGYINRLRDSELSKGITFKKDLTSESIQTFKPKDLKSFLFPENGIIFEPLEHQYIANRYTTEEAIKAELRFAQKLSQGYLTLYKLQLPEAEWDDEVISDNTFVYYVKKEDTYHMLKRGAELLDNGRYKLTKPYVGTLNLIMQDCDAFFTSLKQKIEDVAFVDKRMMALIHLYNTCVAPDVPITTFKDKKKAIIKKGVESSFVVFSPNEVSTTFGYSAGVFLDIWVPSINEKVHLMIGANYLRMPFKTRRYYGNVQDELNYIQIPIIAHFNFSKGPVIPMLGLGVTPYGARIPYLTRSYAGGVFLNAMGGCYIKNFMISGILGYEVGTSSANVKVGYTF